MDVYRPGGITALAILLIIFAALGIIGSIAIIQWEESMFNQSLLSLLLQIIFGVVGTPEQLAFGFLSTALLWYTNYQGMMSTLNIAFTGILILSVLFIITSIGLLLMKKWGYYLALTIGIITIIAGIIAVIPTIGFSIIIIIIGILTIRYLRGEVKYEFQ